MKIGAALMTANPEVRNRIVRRCMKDSRILHSTRLCASRVHSIATRLAGGAHLLLYAGVSDLRVKISRRAHSRNALVREIERCICMSLSLKSVSLRMKTLPLAGLALLCLSVPAFSQTSTIEGIVKDPDGKVLQGAIITIDRTDIKGHYTVKTDKKGHYGHYGLPLGGTFDVTVSVDGQVKDGVKGVHTKGEPATVNFDLKNAQQAAAGAAPGAPAPEADRSLTKEQKAELEKQQKAREAQLAKNKELNDAYTAGRAALD